MPIDLASLLQDEDLGDALGFLCDLGVEDDPRQRLWFTVDGTRDNEALVSEAFATAHRHVVPQEHAGRVQQLTRGREDGLALGLEPGREQLADQVPVVTVEHQRGESVPFAVHQPASAARSGGRLAMSLVSCACKKSRAPAPVTASNP